MDQSFQELDNVLTPHGIIYGLDGSRCYQLVVARTQAQLAAQLLRRARFKVGKVELYPPYATWRQQAARWLTWVAEWARGTQFLLRLWFFRRRAIHHRR